MIDVDLYPPPHRSWKQVLAEFPAEEQEKFLEAFRDAEVSSLEGDFFLNARREQLPPEGLWSIWMIMAGRGFGKTYTGANWLIDKHEQYPNITTGIIAATSEDLRRYCLMGSSGVLSQAAAHFQPHYSPSRTQLEWPNGGITLLFTSERPSRLRGPNLDYAWCDELPYWKYVRATWNNLSFALRKGKKPQRVITMTPRRISIVKELLAREGQDVVVTRGSTYDNVGNLSADFLKELSHYEGTTIGRQEIHGEVLDEEEGALWNHAQLDALRTFDEPKLIRTVVGLDPSTTSGEQADEAGIVVAGKDKDGIGYILGDHSLRTTPYKWAEKAVWCYHHYEANCIVAEKNQGGEMISTIIHNFDKSIPVKLVHASKGKVARAEPVAVEYERGKVKHCGTFPKLEDEMCVFVPGDIIESPNRVDAMVWALTDLVVKPRLKAGTWGRKREKELNKKRVPSFVPQTIVKSVTYKFKTNG